jgi:hypothetical protein
MTRATKDGGDKDLVALLLWWSASAPGADGRRSPVLLTVHLGRAGGEGMVDGGCSMGVTPSDLRQI